MIKTLYNHDLQTDGVCIQHNAIAQFYLSFTAVFQKENIAFFRVLKNSSSFPPSSLHPLSSFFLLFFRIRY